MKQWAKAHPRTAAAATLSLAIAALLLLWFFVRLINGDGCPAFPHWSRGACLEFWIARYQPLLTAILAAAIGAITLYLLWQQSRQTERHATKAHRIATAAINTGPIEELRKLRAASVLTQALVELAQAEKMEALTAMFARLRLADEAMQELFDIAGGYGATISVYLKFSEYVMAMEEPDLLEDGTMADMHSAVLAEADDLRRWIDLIIEALSHGYAVHELRRMNRAEIEAVVGRPHAASSRRTATVEK